MAKRDYRPAAHQAMRDLWFACDEQLRRNGATELLPNGVSLIECQTPQGAEIERFGDTVSVTASFVRLLATGVVEEEVSVVFPEDIRDLADSKVSVDWHEGRKSGTNTVGVMRYPEYAKLMLDSVQQPVVTT